MIELFAVPEALVADPEASGLEARRQAKRETYFQL